jgi:WXG100 family type VII secretion target
MTRVMCDLSDIMELIEALHKTDSGIMQIVKELDKTVADKSGRWSGDSHQAFIRFYREWRRGADVLSSAMAKGIGQLQQMTDGYQKTPQ